MQIASEIDQEIGLREWAQTFWRRRLIIGVTFAAIFGGGVFFAIQDPPVYEAGAVLQVNAAALRPQQADPFSGLFISREAVPTFLLLVDTKPFRDQVAVNLDLPDNSYLGRITASRMGLTDFFRISVRNEDRDLAMDVANEMASVLREESLLEWRTRAATATGILQLQLDLLLQQITNLRTTLVAEEGDPQFLALQLSQLERQFAVTSTELETARAGHSRITDVLTVRDPAVDVKTVGRTPQVVIVLALFLGLFLGIALAVLVEYWDANKIRSPEHVRRLLGVPVIAALPIHPKATRGEGDAPMAKREYDTLLEPYHLLGTNLQYSWTEEGPQVILVTSSGIGEGKTTVLANLAIAQAMAGHRVIAIDADLRRPQLHGQLGVTPDVGLTDFLGQEEKPIQEFLSECPISTGETSGTLSLLAAGAHRSNPSSLLRSENIGRMLTEAKDLADLVLVDGPPVLYSSDPLSLASHVNRVMLIVWSGMLRDHAVQRAREALRVVRSAEVEVVLNRVRRETDTYAYYSYYYYESRERPGVK